MRKLFYREIALIASLIITTSVHARTPSVDDICAVSWPDPLLQIALIKKAVYKANTTSKDFKIDLAAPGLAMAHFTSSKGLPEKAIIAFEFMSPACASNKPEALADIGAVITRQLRW